MMTPVEQISAVRRAREALGMSLNELPLEKQRSYIAEAVGHINVLTDEPGVNLLLGLLGAVSEQLVDMQAAFARNTLPLNFKQRADRVIGRLEGIENVFGHLMAWNLPWPDSSGPHPCGHCTDLSAHPEPQRPWKPK
jgi:hypothetical protein